MQCPLHPTHPSCSQQPAGTCLEAARQRTFGARLGPKPWATAAMAASVSQQDACGWKRSAATPSSPSQVPQAPGELNTGHSMRAKNQCTADDL